MAVCVVEVVMEDVSDVLGTSCLELMIQRLTVEFYLVPTLQMADMVAMVDVSDFRSCCI